MKNIRALYIFHQRMKSRINQGKPKVKVEVSVSLIKENCNLEILFFALARTSQADQFRIENRRSLDARHINCDLGLVLQNFLEKAGYVNSG